jgi:hypothetical protein
MMFLYYFAIIYSYLISLCYHQTYTKQHNLTVILFLGNQKQALLQNSNIIAEVFLILKFLLIAENTPPLQNFTPFS